MSNLTLFCMTAAVLVAMTSAQGLNPGAQGGGGLLTQGMNGGGMGGGMGPGMGTGMGGGMFGRNPMQTILMSRWLDINPWLAMMFGGGMGGGGFGGNMFLPWAFAAM